MKVNGRTIYNMVKVSKDGQMGLHTLACISMGKSKE